MGFPEDEECFGRACWKKEGRRGKGKEKEKEKEKEEEEEDALDSRPQRRYGREYYA